MRHPRHEVLVDRSRRILDRALLVVPGSERQHAISVGGSIISYAVARARRSMCDRGSVRDWRMGG